MNVQIDDVTYEIRKDTITDEALKTSKRYYIRTAYPRKYLTDNMTYQQVQKVAKSMRQLGYTVVDLPNHVH